MDPLASAGVRTVGTVAKAALGRYRPAGVARVGSAEDRAQSYRRFLDAVAHVIDTQILYFFRRRDVEAAGEGCNRRQRARLDELCEEAWRNYAQARHELHAAVLGMRLCAPLQLLHAAEELMDAIPRFFDSEKHTTLAVDDYMATHDLCSETKAKFLEVARRDLAYNPRPWQLMRKLRERRYLKRVAGG